MAILMLYILMTRGQTAIGYPPLPGYVYEEPVAHQQVPSDNATTYSQSSTPNQEAALPHTDNPFNAVLPLLSLCLSVFHLSASISIDFDASTRAIHVPALSMRMLFIYLFRLT